MRILDSNYIFSFLFLFSSLAFQAQNTKFKVVLDAGHGGKDGGNTYHGYLEKNIALKTTLKVGEILSKENDIEIIYTRNKDVFVELKDRADLANKKDANLFVSIHCNSVKNFMPFGTETFVMGMSRTNTNLDVAKNENSVILLEKDYKEKYKGFDPKNPETLIGLKILQEEYLNQSIDLANKIEKNFIGLKRKSRGIKQQPLWVLDASYMPSVLIELGFLSNKEEGSFLNSEEGQNKLAEAIATSILEFKKEYFIGSTNQIEEKDEIKEVENKKEIVKTEESATSTKNEIIFKIQISASTRDLDTKPSNFKGLKNVTKLKDASIIKYYYEATNSYNEAKEYLEQAKEKGYESAFIVPFKNGEKINISEALK